ncbi:MAG: HEAT repeat domain-containing protein [Chloroflexota bacterium]
MLTNFFGWEFDWPEFFAGLAAGALLAWTLTRLLPNLLKASQWASAALHKVSEGLTAGATERYRVDLITRAQTLHLARAIFALDEILISPRVLAPIPPTDPQDSEPLPEGIIGVLPPLPDWTLLHGLYRAPSLSLERALDQGANLLITGEPGSGKTTALAYLAVRCAQRAEELGPLAELCPVLVHAADLRLDRRSAKEPLAPLIAAAQRNASGGVASRLPGYLGLQFRQQKALLLLDGLDEMTPEEIAPYAEWLRELLQAIPGNRLVVAGPIRGYDGLVRAGLAALTMAPWGAHEQRAFLARWTAAWTQFIAPSMPKNRVGEVDPTLITGWLVSSSRGLTPLELTLRAWAAYGGDARGKTTLDSLDAYIARFLSPDERPLAESTALNWINARQGAVPERALQRGTPVGDLVEAGILVRRADGRLSFFQPLVGAYLAARAMIHAGLTDAATRPGWAPAEAALGFYAAWGDLTPLVQAHLRSSGDTLESGRLTCATWLRQAPSSADWKPQLLRALATVLQDARRPYGLRLRALQALVSAGEASVSVLFRRLLAAEAPTSRALAALGLGGVRDEESISKLTTLINQDPHLRPRQAGCLALASIGTDSALEALGHALLSGEEAVRLAAAEALACHPDEGYSMLREAVGLDNLLTRRAAVFGLARVPENWVLEILEKVQVDDSQWVVRGAAAEAAERRRNPPWKVAAPVIEPAALPWLVAFAAREGLGVAPGRAAMEMLRRALSTGKPEEKVAALEALAWMDTTELSYDIHQALASPEPALRDTAYETLWHLAASGVELPSPVQSGVAK